MRRSGITLAIIALIICACRPAPPSSGTGSKIHEVAIESLRFSPATLVVHRGDTIRFKNADIIPHTVTEMASKVFDSGMINAGAEWKFVPASTGTFRYHCLYHPQMEGVITVEASAAAGSTPGS